MRVTFATVNRNVQRNLSRRYADMVNLQEQLATGKRLRKPSDDPIDVANSIKLRTKHTQLKQYKRNIEDGLAIMGVASSAMASMNDLLHRSRELAVQAANGTYTDSDRTYMQKEVDQLFRQMMSVINTQFKGNYIFNGTNTKTPPYIIASSSSELTSYVNRSMATYGQEFEVSLVNTENYHSDDDIIYLDYRPLTEVRIGDRLQLRWQNTTQPDIIDDSDPDNIIYDLDTPGYNPEINGRPVSNILPGTFSLDTIVVSDATNPGSTLTFQIGIDYALDQRSGVVTVISEELRNALNRARLSDDPLVDMRIDQRPRQDVIDDITGDTVSVPVHFQYSLNNTFQIVGGKFGEAITDIFPGSFKLRIGDKEYKEGFGEFKGDWYDTDGVLQRGENVFDYSIDYETGKITIYNMELMRDMRPEWLGGPDAADPDNIFDNMYRAGQLRMDFDYITRGTNIYGDRVTSQGDILRAIEAGIKEPININADDLLRDRGSGNEMVGVLLRYSQALLKDDRESIQRALDELTNMYDAVLNSQSEMGAKVYRFELTLRRNEEQTIEVAIQNSALEDADLAEVISRLLLAENVYSASLQAAMRVIQPSLANFM
jgi:flagellin-like hook-associated protein FlgL